MSQTPVQITHTLRDALLPLDFAAPVTHVYNPLLYAGAMYEGYLERFGSRTPREIILVGMNPGPWGMAQTGVPFGEVNFVRDWMGFGGRPQSEAIGTPDNEHPKRPVLGLQCARSEVSGARLWGWARERYGSAEEFFARYFVHNYCPLVFMEESGRNRTPNRLLASERFARRLRIWNPDILSAWVNLPRSGFTPSLPMLPTCARAALSEASCTRARRALRPIAAGPSRPRHSFARWESRSRRGLRKF